MTERDAVNDEYLEIVGRGSECIPGTGEVKRGQNEAGNREVGIEGVRRGRNVSVEGAE